MICCSSNLSSELAARKAVDSALCGFGIGVESIEGFHSGTSVGSGPSSTKPWCLPLSGACAMTPPWGWSPTFISQIGNHRHEFRKQQVEQRHQAKARSHQRVFHPGGPIVSPGVGQVLVIERGHDDQEALDPHAHDDCA